MPDVGMLLDDPELTTRSPGEEFALARMRMGDNAAVTLRAAISELFPPALRRPRYTVRSLLRRAVVGSEPGDVMVFRELAAAVTADTAAPEWDFDIDVASVPIQTISAAVPVPPQILADPAALAAFIDYRLLVRLCTAENDVLLNGAGRNTIRGLLRMSGVRAAPAAATVAATLLSAAAQCEWYGGSADGIVMHPADWWPLLAEGALLDRLESAGVKISRTRMVPRGTALVGDFTSAATLLDRRRSTIRMAAGGERRLAGPGVVAEIEEGLAIHLPGHFVIASLGTGAAS